VPIRRHEVVHDHLRVLRPETCAGQAQPRLLRCPLLLRSPLVRACRSHPSRMPHPSRKAAHPASPSASSREASRRGPELPGDRRRIVTPRNQSSHARNHLSRQIRIVPIAPKLGVRGCPQFAPVAPHAVAVFLGFRARIFGAGNSASPLNRYSTRATARPRSSRARQAGSGTAPWRRDPKRRAPRGSTPGPERAGGIRRSMRRGRYLMTGAYSMSAYRMPPVRASCAGEARSSSWHTDLEGPVAPGTACSRTHQRLPKGLKRAHATRERLNRPRRPRFPERRSTTRSAQAVAPRIRTARVSRRSQEAAIRRHLR
jgi:hypothetical protein